MSRRTPTSLPALLALLTLAVHALVAPAGAAAQGQHTVRAGQSMAQIARRHHVDVWDLALASGLRPSATLRPGQTLTIPAPHSTYVRPGQTLSEIARAHDCTAEELMSLNRLRRGAVLRVGRRLFLPGYEAPQSVPARGWGAPDAPGTATLRRRDETLTVALVDAERRVTRAGVDALAQLMRPHESDAPELPHPRLALLLAAISDHFGGREITIVSGRREAGGYTRESSRHTEGRATDIRVRGVSARALWDYCRTLVDTGCGYYPRSTFVHVDVRTSAAQWVDWSSPGRRARYGNLSRPWPRMCRRADRRRHRLCQREGRR
ncbi:MAG: LysM peptidoglycan-binding domain-containing protein, partial [Myxococcota bacterium]|nr:LysM peptidoglycan-binding domain-containing protein [Myxococcota bacterium]